MADDEWFRAEIGDDMPITAHLRGLYAEYGSTPGAGAVDMRTLALAAAVYRLERRVAQLERQAQ
ncbi:hypothetical protein GR927_20595 [Mycolicibacterium sp. 3033]|nr:hypothetical protein [Mycolicibacterium aurantiacum]